MHLKVSLFLPAAFRQLGQCAPKVPTRKMKIVRSPSRWSVNSSAGGSSVILTIATFVPPSAILANTRLPPSTSEKYAASRATSAPGLRQSPGKAGTVAGGDRLPWVPAASGADNFTALKSCNWQVHLYGGDPVSLSESCARLNLPLQVYPWSEAAGRAGLAEGAAYLIRPDGDVGLADPQAQRTTIAAYWARLHLPSRV